MAWVLVRGREVKLSVVGECESKSVVGADVKGIWFKMFAWGRVR